MCHFAQRNNQPEPLSHKLFATMRALFLTEKLKVLPVKAKHLVPYQLTREVEGDSVADD
jgi:hypothetical protein